MTYIPAATIARAFKNDDGVRAELAVTEKEIAKLPDCPRRKGLKVWAQTLKQYLEKKNVELNSTGPWIQKDTGPETSTQTGGEKI